MAAADEHCPPVQEQAKKKARADRFGASTGKPAPSPTVPGAVKSIVSEEEAAKRQARALRFSTGLPPAKEASSGTTAEQVGLTYL